jgi:hypothetical protein
MEDSPSNLPRGWFNRDRDKLAKEFETWPAWMKAGVQESIERAQRQDHEI